MRNKLLLNRLHLLCYFLIDLSYSVSRKPLTFATGKIMITSRKISQINVFAGSPWEVESVKQLLKSAYITASTEDKGYGIHVSVPCQQYTAAMRVISNRKAL